MDRSEVKSSQARKVGRRRQTVEVVRGQGLLKAASSSEMAVNMVVEQGGVPFRGENTSFETANRRRQGLRNPSQPERPTKGPSPIRSGIVIYSPTVCVCWCIGHACGMPRFIIKSRATANVTLREPVRSSSVTVKSFGHRTSQQGR